MLNTKSARPLQVSIIGGYPLYQLGITNILHKLNLNFSISYHCLSKDIKNYTDHSDIAIFFVTPDFLEKIKSINQQKHINTHKTVFLTQNKAMVNFIPTTQKNRSLVLPLAIPLKEAELYLHSFIVKDELKTHDLVNSSENIQSLFLRDLNILTQREKQIIHLISQGYDNREIAIKLEIRHNTVKVFIGKIYKKLDILNKAQATKLYLSTQYATC